MILTNAYIKNFRNISETALSFHPQVNIILGKNAQGKTNLLEALWLFSGNRSFRGSSDREFIGFDETSYFISAKFLRDGEESIFKIGCELNGDKITKKVVKNEKAYKTSSCLLGAVPMTVFSPDDLTLIKEGPSKRRNYCDVLLSTLFPTYSKTLSRYNRIVMQKNALLKDEAPLSQIEIWNEQLALFGASVIKSRVELLKRILPYAQKSFNEMSGSREELKIEYKCSFLENPDIEENEIAAILSQKLNDNFYKESAAKSCLYGPHRDDLLVLINGRDSRLFASQGQQRSAVLALLLSKTELIKNHSGKAPIVLLDDVMSELDAGRQSYLLEKIEGFQVFITCCQDEIFKEGKNKKTFYVENGEIRE